MGKNSVHDSRQMYTAIYMRTEFIRICRDAELFENVSQLKLKKRRQNSKNNYS